MIDYKELYLDMFRATEKAMSIIQQAQRECEMKYCEEADAQAEPEREE